MNPVIQFIVEHAAECIFGGLLPRPRPEGRHYRKHPSRPTEQLNNYKLTTELKIQL